MDAIRPLSGADLDSLAAALRGGRLSPPFTAAAVQRSCPPAHAAAVAAEFQRLAEEGMLPIHLALLLETFAKLRAAQQRMNDIVELVWTGPELPGTVNRDTAVVVRDLFGSARTHVLVAGYVVYQGHEVFRALATRMDQNPGLRVRMFLGVKRERGDTTATSQILHQFAHRFREREWPGKRLPEVFYDPRSLEMDSDKRASLHAKCIAIDRQIAFVSSANFTQAAQARNIEVGTLIHSEHFAMQLVDHFERLAAENILVLLPGYEPRALSAPN